ncbi:hypothetical protein [uncultured Winogradskyella sp.]|uniref:hypothetical protein n=1 Tax=uncultured Winogradskyella sp. TaxID=395353 RepID=UPI00261D2872|nr:hypothetical protein [uncultured Winogradskyella sp.]
MKSFFLLIVMLLLTSCYNIERNCSDYQTGTFEFNYSVDGIEKIGRFTRTETLNIDYHEEREADSSSVRWINDCEFILKTINPKSNAEKDDIHMKILSTTDDTYTFEYKRAIKKPNREWRVEKGVAKRIN